MSYGFRSQPDNPRCCERQRKEKKPGIVLVMAIFHKSRRILCCPPEIFVLLQRKVRRTQFFRFSHFFHGPFSKLFIKEHQNVKTVCHISCPFKKSFDAFFDDMLRVAFSSTYCVNQDSLYTLYPSSWCCWQLFFSLLVT